MAERIADLNDLAAAVEEFTPRQWLSVTTAVPIEEYEQASGALHRRMGSMVGDMSEAVRGETEHRIKVVIEAAERSFPSLRELRSEMRPFKRAGGEDLAAEQYDLLRTEGLRRTRIAATALVLRDEIAPRELRALLAPVSGVVGAGNPEAPPSLKLSKPPATRAPLQVTHSFEDALTLAFLASTRWAAERGYSTPALAIAAWRSVGGRWLRIFMASHYDHPSMAISIALGRATSELVGQPLDSVKPLLPAVEEAASRSAEGLLDLVEPLAEYSRNMPRSTRQWITERVGRTMKALLTQEVAGKDNKVAGAPQIALIRRTLGRMGFEYADWSGLPQTGGVIRLPQAWSWWEPAPVELSLNTAVSTRIGLSAPDAMDHNLRLLIQANRLSDVVAWYETEVLPLISDNGGPREWYRLGVGRSSFSGYAPYDRQPESVRWLLWALADALLASQSSAVDRGEDTDAITRLRLPLLRAIWNGEIRLAAMRALGYEQLGVPELGEPGSHEALSELSETHDKLSDAATAFLGVTRGQPIDQMSAFQIAVAARAAALRHVATARGAGCGSAALAMFAFVVALVAVPAALA